MTTREAIQHGKEQLDVFGGTHKEFIEVAIEALQERKTGKWKTAYLDHVAMGVRPKVLYCSACEQCIAYPTNYCPNCGAKMEADE